MQIQTQRLILRLDTLENARAKVAGMSDGDKANLSTAWLSLLAAATTADPWVLGFQVSLHAEDSVIGQCGFKGPPTTEGSAEIAYVIEPEWQGNGYATEAAKALVDFAFQQEQIKLVIAHTLPHSSASTRVLTKCGFFNVGEVMDPEDGPVWRWHKFRQ